MLGARIARRALGLWNLVTARPLTWLGDRSYSLYAVHFPIALLVWAGIGRLGLGHSAAVLATLAAGVPLSVAVAHVCYRLVEQPSLRRVTAVGRRLSRM